MVRLNVLPFTQTIAQVYFFCLFSSILENKFDLYSNISGQPGATQQVTFSPAGPLSIHAGGNQLIHAPSGYQAFWTRADGQPLPSGVSQTGNDLQIAGARPEHSGTYNCELYGSDGAPIRATYEIHVQGHGRPHVDGKC